MKEDIQVAVVGAGMIGLGLCALLTGNGIHTCLYVRDRADERRARYQSLMDDLEKDGLLTQEEKNYCESYLQIAETYEQLQDAQIAFECVAENIDVKRTVYEKLYEACPGLLAVASTTSALSSQELAACSKMPSKIIVAHPFYPAHLIPCVEVVPNGFTSETTLQTIVALLHYLKREVVIIKKDAPGFIANRLQYALLREAVNIVESGIASPEEVDRVLMYSFIPRYTSIGIFEHFDNCGLDLTRDICNYLYPDLANAGSAQNLIADLCAKHAYGVKSGRGIYDWDEEKRQVLKEHVKAPYNKFFSWNIPQKVYKNT